MSLYFVVSVHLCHFLFFMLVTYLWFPTTSASNVSHLCLIASPHLVYSFIIFVMHLLQLGTVTYNLKLVLHFLFSDSKGIDLITSGKAARVCISTARHSPSLLTQAAAVDRTRGLIRDPQWDCVRAMTEGKQAVRYAGDRLSKHNLLCVFCFFFNLCTHVTYVHVTEWRQDLYQITFNLSIHPLPPPPTEPETQREREQALKVSECGLFTHDLPLILKQEYIIVHIQFEERLVSAFSLSSPVMGRDWDGCECLILFNSVWFSCGMSKHTDRSKYVLDFTLLVVVVVVGVGVGCGSI